MSNLSTNLLVAQSYYREAQEHMKKHAEAKRKYRTAIANSHEKKAVKLLTQASERGHSQASYELALYHANVCHTFDSPNLALTSYDSDEIRKSLELLKLAADQGHTDALYELGRYYYIDTCTYDHTRKRAINWSQALFWFQKANEKGHPHAWEHIAHIFSWQQNQSKEFFSLLASHIPTDEKTLRTWEFAEPLYNLYAIHNGDLLGEDPERSLFFEPFIKAGNRNITFRLTNDEKGGDWPLIKQYTMPSGEQDHFVHLNECRKMFLNQSNDLFKEAYYTKEETFRWLEQHKDRDLWACHHYGMCYYKGYYVTKDYAKAVSCFKNVAAMDMFTPPLQPENTIALGDCYLFGYGVTKDYKMAKDYYERTIHLNLSEHKKNPAKANQPYHDDRDRTLYLAFCYKMLGDYTKAFPLFQTGVNHYGKNAAWAMANLGNMYYNGQGTPVDYSRAFNYLSQAAESGISNSMIMTGHCYYYGQGVAKDGANAFRWFQKAKEAGDIAAPYYLGYCYQTGFGVEKNLTTALKYFKESVSQNYNVTDSKNKIAEIEGQIIAEAKKNNNTINSSAASSDTVHTNAVSKQSSANATPSAVKKGLARKELDSLIGLGSVKEEISHLENIILANARKKAMGLPTMEVSKHMVFTGNPGTGKTTVARIVAQIFKESGLLEKGQLVETDRSGLVDQYIGGTAPKTKKKFQEALGGVLFIDEAYALIPEDSDRDFGPEAVATLLKLMEDHKDEIVVIVAGYEKDMHRFIDSNSGLKSRFTTYIDFPDYTPNELQQIFDRTIAKDQYILDPKAREKLVALWQASTDYANLGNGRAVRNVYEKIQRLQATRIVKDNLESKLELMTILAEDIPSAEDVFQ